MIHRITITSHDGNKVEYQQNVDPWQHVQVVLSNRRKVEFTTFTFGVTFGSTQLPNLSLQPGQVIAFKLVGDLDTYHFKVGFPSTVQFSLDERIYLLDERRGVS